MRNIDYTEFKGELTALLNKYSIESTCDIPDFLLATSICKYLELLSDTLRGRDGWFSVDMWKDNGNPRQIYLKNTRDLKLEKLESEERSE